MVSPRRAPDERGGDLHHARILGAAIGVDLGEEVGLVGEGGGFDRVEVGIELPVHLGGADVQRAVVAQS